MATKKNIENKDELFDETNIPESNWFKFVEVGDRVSGEVVEVMEKKATIAGYPDQRVFVMKQKNGELINVGVKVTSDYLMSRTNGVTAGDMIGFEFKKEIPAKKKGFRPAKSIEVYVKKGEPKEESEDNFGDFK